MFIPFNCSSVMPTSRIYLDEVFKNGKLSGGGSFTKKCTDWIEDQSGAHRALLTTSCSHALDMAARLCDFEPGDEVIMSSYTFPSAANSFVAVGVVVVFVDIRPDTMNIDENLIEAAITDRTRAISPMHYAGIACEMDSINALAERYRLKVVEDAAHAVMASYKGKALGTLSQFGCYSFHETKNYSMGEGGALLLRDPKDAERAEMILEKGTDRRKFFRGQVDKYSWKSWGSSYIPSELNAAYLWSQLEVAQEIHHRRMEIWNQYWHRLSPLADKGLIRLPVIPGECAHPAHIFYFKVKDLKERTALLRYLTDRGVLAVYHYVPLHSSEAGRKFGRFFGDDVYTTIESERLIRLPLYYDLSVNAIEYIVQTVYDYFGIKQTE